MARARIDPSLTLPSIPDRAPAIGSADPGLALAGPAADAPFVVEGARCRVLGRERGGADSIFVGGTRVASNVTLDGPTVANVVVAPGVLRRERVGAGAGVAETALAPPSLPLAAFQFAASGGPDRGEDLGLSLDLLPDAAGVRYRVLPEGIVAVDEEHPDVTVCAVTLPAAREWGVSEGADGGLRVRVVLDSAPAHTTLLVAAGTVERLRIALAGGRHLTAHEVRAGQGPEGGLRLRSGVSEIDQGMAWARTRVAGALGRPRDADPGDLLITGIGGLCGGDFDAVRDALEQRLDQGEAEGRPLSASLLLLAARFALASGTTAPAERAMKILGATPPSGSPEMVARAFVTLADALQHAASAETVAALRAAGTQGAAAPPPSPAGATGTRRLPVLGSPSQSGVRLPTLGTGTPPRDALVAWLLGDGSGSPPAAAGAGSLAAWLAAATRPPVEGWGEWRSDLAAGLQVDERGRGAWDLPEAATAPGAGGVLGAFMHGILGWSPDAPMHRLTLAPTLPEHVTTLRVEGIPIGDVRVHLEFRRDGFETSFHLDPVEGRSPPMLVFAPWLPFVPAEVFLGDEPAELDARPEGAGSRVPVQVPLDRALTVRFLRRAGESEALPEEKAGD